VDACALFDLGIKKSADAVARDRLKFLERLDKDND
jgi:hypothetical protein